MRGTTHRRYYKAGALATGVIALLISGAILGWRGEPPASAASSPMIPRAAAAAGKPGGDVPDNAVYLRYTGRGVSMEYVEGWLQTTTPHGITFEDKDSAVAVDLRPRSRASLTAYVARVDLPQLARGVGFVRGALTRDTVAGYPSLRLTYRGRSAPDLVTGTTVALQVERYYVDGPRALAVLTLSTPLGVDNADAFRRIAHSFRFH